MKLAPIAIACLALATLPDALAQRMPGGGSGGGYGGRGEMPRRDRESRPSTAPAAAPEVFAAMEREMPSLKVDLLLKASQVEAWARFERGVRQCAELERMRRRHVASVREAEATPSAAHLLAIVEEDDRQRAEASAELRRLHEALVALLDPPQQAMLDRRLLQSQAEPLGLEAPGARRRD